MRLWDRETSDINKVKRIKFHKRIRDIIHTPDKVSVVIYEDGSCESLQSALDSRKEQKDLTLTTRDFVIENPSISSSGIFSYIKKIKEENIFCYSYLDNLDSYRQIGEIQTFPISRPGILNVRLIGSTVVTSNDESLFISVWSDKRIFSTALKGQNDGSINKHLSLIDIVSGKKDAVVAPISDKCIVIYAASDEEESSSLLIYNLRYKVIQSRIPFKVFIPFTRFWVINNHIYLALGQYLKAIPFLVGEDKLSAMIGSQRESAENAVDNEMINEDAFYENFLEFDIEQEPVEGGMEFVPNKMFWKHQKKYLSGAKAIASSDEVRSQLDELYRGDIIVELVKSNDLPNDVIMAKLLSNVDESAFMLSESVEYYCGELEKHGYSEIEITNKIVPVLIKAYRTEDIGLLLKRYSNISERMLVNIVKYIIQCPNDENDGKRSDEIMEVNDGVSLTKDDLCKEKKFRNKNAFLSTKQNDKRDVLTIALCSAFDSPTILPYIRNLISLPEMVQLMNHLYTILTAGLLNDPYDVRGNLVEGDDFDLDTKLFEWFRLLLDSHYQQILWSRDKELEEKLIQWLSLVDSHIGILSEMKNLRPVVSKIAQNKSLQLSKKCNQWYTIEKLKLY